MNAEASVPNPVAGDQVVIGVREIHPVPLVMDGIVENPVALRFPEMDAVPARGRSHVRAADDLVHFDEAVADAMDVDAESIVFNAAATHDRTWSVNQDA